MSNSKKNKRNSKRQQASGGGKKSSKRKKQYRCGQNNYRFDALQFDGNIPVIKSSLFIFVRWEGRREEGGRPHSDES